MNPILIDIRDLIVDDADTNYIFANDLFISKQPTSPINIVTLFDTSTAPPDMTLGDDVYLNEAVMILIRNETWMGAQQVAQDIITILNGKSNFTKNSTNYLWVNLANGPNQMTVSGASSKGTIHPELTLNFKIQREKS